MVLNQYLGYLCDCDLEESLELRDLGSHPADLQGQRSTSRSGKSQYLRIQTPIPLTRGYEGSIGMELKLIYICSELLSRLEDGDER